MATSAQVNVLLGLDNARYKKGIEEAKSQMGVFNQSIGLVKNGLLGLAAGFSMAAVVGEMKSAYQAFEESERVQRVLEATLKATGYAAGLTGDEIADMASEFMNLTGIDDEVIKGAQNILLTFRNISGSIFPETTQAVLDMATVMGTDFNSAALKIGKALNDPIQGLNALRRAGVAFTKDQQEQIKVLVKSGEGLKAQKIILEELNKEFGGAAAAASTGTKKLSNAFGELQETLGRFISGGIGNKFVDFLTSVIKRFDVLIDRIRIATTALNQLSSADIKKQINDLENSKHAKKWGVFTIRPELNDYEKSIVNKKISQLRSQLKVTEAKEKNSRPNITAATPEFSTGKESKQKKKNDPAQSAYESINNELNSKLRESQALKSAITRINSDYGATGLQSFTDEQINNIIELYQQREIKIAEIRASGAKHQNELIKKEDLIFLQQRAKYFQDYTTENQSKQLELAQQLAQTENKIAFEATVGNNKVIADALEAEKKEREKHAKEIKDIYDRLNQSLYEGIGDNLRKLAQGTISFKGFMLGVLADIARQQAAIALTGFIKNNSGGLLSSAAKIGTSFLGIPMFAGGTDYAPGGLSIVGEKGPELVDLQPGAKVYPNHKLSQLGGQQTVVLSMSPMFQSLDPNQGQKMFNDWMKSSGLPMVASAMKNNGQGFRQIIRSI